MNQIKIDCFATTDNYCQLVSLDEAIKFSEPSEKEAIIEINNQGSKPCFVKMGVRQLNIDKDLQNFTLIVRREKQILFNGDFINSSTTEVDLGEILPNSSATYIWQMDLLDLVLAEEKLFVNFSLFFDFVCEDFANQIDQEQKAYNSKDKQSEQKVLSAISQTETVSESSKFFQKPIYLLLSLSVLFVIIFFVIMKFIHDQKKKKQRKIRT